MNSIIYLALVVVTFYSLVSNVDARWGKNQDRRGRRLNGSEVSQRFDCYESMMYELGLQLVGSSGTHISFIAKPQCNTSEEESCECPILFIDSSPNLAGDYMDQAIYAWNNQDDLVVDDQESFMLGLFPLKAILNSFDVASNQHDGIKYDFTSNNCASFLISMGHSLGIDPADKRITSFVAKQISNEYVMTQLLETDAGNVYTKNYDIDDEAVVVENFISNYIHQRI